MALATPNRGRLACPLAVLAFLLLWAPKSSLASDSLAEGRGHARLDNGVLVVFEQRPAWRSAAVCVLLTPPPNTPPEESVLLTRLAEQVLISGCEGGLPDMLADAGYVPEGLRWYRRSNGILIALEVAPAELEQAAGFLADMLDFTPDTAELTAYMEWMGRNSTEGDVGADDRELVRRAILGIEAGGQSPLALPTPDELSEFLQGLLEPQNVTVSICAPEILQSAVSLFGRLVGAGPGRPADSLMSSGAGALSPMGGKIYSLQGNGTLTRITLGFSLPCTSREEYWTAQALATVLAGPRFSRLYQSLRRQEGLAYDAKSNVERAAGRVLVTVECLVARQASAQARDLLTAEVERLAAGGASDEECRRAREYLKGMLMGRWQRPIDAAMQGAEEVWGESEIDSSPWHAVEAVTTSEINSAAREMNGRWVMCVHE